MSALTPEELRQALADAQAHFEAMNAAIAPLQARLNELERAFDFDSMEGLVLVAQIDGLIAARDRRQAELHDLFQAVPCHWDGD